MNIDHSFLIPLYNEEVNIVHTIETISMAAKQLPSYEMIIVDDGSRDHSYQFVKNLLGKYPEIKLVQHLKNLGFASAYQTALKLASGKTCQYIPSDNVINAADLEALLMAKDNASVVFQYCLNPTARKPMRSFISQNYTRILNSIHQKELHYYNGLNIYPRNFLLQQNFSTDSFAFQAELAIKAVNELDYVQIGIQCQFKDSSSSALRFSNILKVIHFLMNQRKRKSYE